MGGHSSGGLFPGTIGSSGLSYDEESGDNTIRPSIGNGVDKERKALLNEASTDEARRIVSELYRKGASVGDGGTADAIREELATGKTVSGRSHVRKGRERLRQIERILQRNPNHPDRVLLERLSNDLRSALEGN